VLVLVAAAARASVAALRVCKAAIQFHGSMGFADEVDIGLHLRRAMAIGAQLGGTIANERLFATGT
jgi:alkylation response protein AidB-like acyl-CoA dehydrogenase